MNMQLIINIKTTGDQESEQATADLIRDALESLLASDGIDAIRSTMRNPPEEIRLTSESVYHGETIELKA